MRDERKILGDFAVYPGHPVTLAYLITHSFPNYEAAAKQTEHGFPEALGCEGIPGAGGNVYAAMALLHRIADGTHSDEESVAWADDYWARLMKSEDKVVNGVSQKREPGQRQADSVKRALLERLEGWF